MPSVEQTLDVLVVDDDPAVASLLRAILERAGLAVDVAADGAEALASLCLRDYGVVLADHTMPAMTGLELVRAAEREGHRVAFLIMSAFLAPETLEAVCAEPGVAGVLAKPFDVAALVRDVRAVLRHRRAPETPAPASAPARRPASPARPPEGAGGALEGGAAAC